MDEPLSNLDAKLRVEMRNAIKRIQQQVGITTIYVTHDQEGGPGCIGPHRAVMNGGVIQQIDTPRTCTSGPPISLFPPSSDCPTSWTGALRQRDGQTLLHIGDYSVPMENLSRSALGTGQAVKVSIRP